MGFRFLNGASVCAVALLMTLGCHSTSHGTKMDQAKLDQIQKGKTTKSEMITWFGPPASIGRDDTGQQTATWMYASSDTKVKGSTFIPYAGMFMGGATGTSESQTLFATFDSNNVLQKYNLSGSAQNLDSSSNPFGGGTTVTNAPANGAK